MALSKDQKANILFGVQILSALLFGGGQLIHMLLQTIAGINATWYVSWLVFLILNLVLTVRAYRNEASRAKLYQICTYSVWTVLILLDLLVLIWKGVRLNGQDAILGGLVTLGVSAIFAEALRRKQPLADPMIKGWLAVCFKAIPQLILAVNIACHGGAGLSFLAIIGGHVGILARLAQLGFPLPKKGLDRNILGSALSEYANEGSWIVVTIVWIAWR
jgi:uncharacterized membrane-anchored protein YitT (DUF2179 family)